MSWTKYRERRPSPEVSINDSKDSSLNEETHQEENVSVRSIVSNRERWLEEAELVERRPKMKQNDCVPFLVQLIHSRDQSPDVREGASSALRNVIHAFDDKKGREKHIFELLEQLRDYSEMLKLTVTTGYVPDNLHNHPNSTMTSLMKLSFKENYHRVICYLGGLQTIAELMECEHAAHGSETNERECITLRRDSGMTLASLIVGDTNNKALLCSFRDFIKVWVTQLFSPCEELRQVTASVFCNLSWRADNESKQALREAEVVTGLMKAAMRCRKESSLKTILSALWNLSAHCAANKAEICAVEGALAFLVNMLCYESQTKGLAIAENAGGIIRNVSSHIAVREDHRAILRQKNCIHILVRHLKSSSLTVVSNACGTLWNLSAWCPRDQKTLWELGAIPLLRNLTHSKHKMISMGANSALRNLLSAKGANGNLSQESSRVRKSTIEIEENTGSTMTPRKRDSPLDMENQKGGCVKKNVFSDSMHRYDREFVPIDNRPFSYERPKSRSVPTAYISTEPGKKLKFCIKLTNDSEYDEGKENFRSSNDVPWNSPPDIPSYTRARVCSPVEESQVSASPAVSNFEKPFTNFINRSPSDSTCDEDINDQPIDYSKKYSERNQSANLLANETEISPKEEFSNHDDKVNLFGDYVETDLDQPTDYSLRYAEDDTDEEEEEEEEKENPEYFPRNEQEDTVKTYCTEGTPYQTPFNFSTATSMSDLRVEDVKEGGEKKFSKKMDLRKNSDSVTKDSQFDESQEMQEEEGEKDLLNSDVNLAEKPISYCVEDTPQCFSRVSSFSSLGSAVVAQNLSIETVSEEAVGNDITSESVDPQSNAEQINTKNTPSTSVEREKNESRIIDKEGKMVTFGREDRYAEQTPLMFSRCSSLGSLSGFEQHSIRDDLSSGISDFSRMTSGVVSPSELPDSPTQTVPPSPRHKHQHSEFGRKSQNEPRLIFQAPSCSKMQSAKRSVFEDEMAAFKDESTPLEFSAATSLSSLTIDDEPKLPKFRMVEKRSVVPESVECTGNSEETSHLPQLKKENQVDDCKDNQTLPSERYTSTDQNSINVSQSSCNLRRFETSFTLDRLDSAFKRGGQNVSLRNVTDRVDLVESLDSVHIYCTEDTPDGSISNLSALSMPSIPDDNENIDHNKLLYLANQRSKSSDEASNSSGDNEIILRKQVESVQTKKKVSPQNSAQNSSIEVPLNSCNNSSTSLIPNRSFKVERTTPEPSEDSVSLTEEENNKLDQLIESAMPKRRLNDSSSLTTSEQNLERSSSPAPSVGSNSFTEEETNKLTRLIETSSVPSSPKLINTRASNSNLQQTCKIDNSSVLFEDNTFINDKISPRDILLLESELRHFNIHSNSHSLRSSSPIADEFYRSNPCGRSSSPTTLMPSTRKDNSSPAPSEDSNSLTEEENIKLDQLIESAMPKRQNTLSPSPRSNSPKLVISKSNYNSPSRKIHSSSQSEILLRSEMDFPEDENSRLNQLIEAGMPKKKLSVSSRSSPINVRSRTNQYNESSLPLTPQQSYKSRVNRDSFNDFAVHKERLDQLIQSGNPKKRGNGPKTSPTKVPDRSNKLNSRLYHSNRQNFFRGDRIKPEPDDDTISLTEEDNMKLDQLIESAMPKKQSQSFHRSSSGRVLDDIPANRMLPYGCSSPPSFRQNSCKNGKMKIEQNENRNSLTEEENLRLDELIESAMPKKRNSSLKPSSSKIPENIAHRSNTCIRSSNPSLRRHAYGNVGKWKYYKRLSFSRILRFIRESYP